MSADEKIRLGILALTVGFATSAFVFSSLGLSITPLQEGVGGVNSF